MITSLRLVNFKNFADETLRVGPFTLLVGTNASGKSNIRDAFRFLHGIGRRYTLAEIMGGKYGGVGQLEWAGIRGAPSEVTRLERIYVNDWYDWSTFTIQLELSWMDERGFYLIKVGHHPVSGFIVLEESLRADSGIIYRTKETGDSSNYSLLVGSKGDELPGLSRVKPALTQLSEHLLRGQPILSKADHELVELFCFRALVAMLSIRFLEPSADRMKAPSFPGATILGDFGENLATVLQAICSDSARRDVLTAWLRELTPMDVRDFQFPSDPNGWVYLRILEGNGRKISVTSASDGTLRFLVMLAALLGTDPAGLYFFEEIDNGIHPARLSLLIDLLERQTAKDQIQVVATTHSPGLLDMVSDATFENTSVVYRDENSADAIIRPVAGLPRVRELRKSQGLGRLHAAGWMENMLAFAEANNDDGEDSQ